MFHRSQDPLCLTLVMTCFDDIAPLTSGGVFIQTAFITIVTTCAFMLAKRSYDHFRQKCSAATLVVIGAGPIGLLSVIIAVRTGKISRAILFEEKSRNDLRNRPQQIALDNKSVHFLKSIGVDFDNIEGCWDKKRFFTRIGVFQEYLMDILANLGMPIEVRLKQKFSKETLKELDAIQGRLLVVICEGSSGHTSGLLGLSDEFVQQSCRSYGAVAALNKPDAQFVPTPETRIHNLTFDLNAYGNDCYEPLSQGFHLKVFGSLRHRYMSLAVPKCESKLVKTLKVVLDQSVMRSIFQACYNKYRPHAESAMSDMDAIKCMKFSPRLFEIRLSERIESAAFIQDANLFVITEGEATRCLNFHSGMDINVCIRGLTSLGHFIKLAVPAETEPSITRALNYKIGHTKSVTQDFIKNGIRETMYT